MKRSTESFRLKKKFILDIFLQSFLFVAKKDNRKLPPKVTNKVPKRLSIIRVPAKFPKLSNFQGAVYVLKGLQGLFIFLSINKFLVYTS